MIVSDTYDRNGWDEHGFGVDGIHRNTGTKYDENGFDKNHFKTGFNRR